MDDKAKIKATCIFSFIVLFVGIVFFVVTYVTIISPTVYTVEGKLVDVWFNNESLNVNYNSHYWIVVELENKIPRLYFFTGNDFFGKSAEQKATDGYEETLLLMDKNITLTYKVKSRENQLPYFVSVEEVK